MKLSTVSLLSLAGSAVAFSPASKPVSVESEFALEILDGNPTVVKMANVAANPSNDASETLVGHDLNAKRHGLDLN
jgi:hypothetical protein